MSDAEWANKKREREAKNREWQQRKLEWASNAQTKRTLLSQMEHLANNPNQPNSGDAVKKLSSQFKDAGFAGKTDNQQLGDAFYAARTRFYDSRKQYLDQVKLQWQQAESLRRQLIQDLHSIVSSGDTGKQNAQIVKDIHSRWKDAGFAGKEAMKALNDEYYKLRNSFYEESKRKWERWAYDADKNRDYARQLVDKMSGYANDPHPGNWSNQVQALISEFRGISGPMRKKDRQELQRKFWAEKDRFYARRDAEKARPKDFEKGNYKVTATQRNFGGGPENFEQAKQQLDAAIRDAEARVRDADSYYESVRSRDSKFRIPILPSKQLVDEQMARERQRIANENLFKLRERRKRMDYPVTRDPIS